MHPSVQRLRVGFGGALFGLAVALSGCATAHDKDERKVVVEDQYVNVDAPVGSHMKRRVKLSELKEPGISPTRKASNEDINTVPPPPLQSGVVEQMVTNVPPGGG